MRTGSLLSFSAALALSCGAPPDGVPTVDDGRLLSVTDAMTPPFGAQTAMRRDADFSYALEVQTDSRSVAGRLYVEVDGKCCDLEVPGPPKFNFLQDASIVTGGEPGRFRVSFIEVRPCYHVPPGSIAYVIPVVAAGGFVGGPLELVKAVGTLNKDHHWSVQCP